MGGRLPRRARQRVLVRASSWTGLQTESPGWTCRRALLYCSYACAFLFARLSQNVR